MASGLAEFLPSTLFGLDPVSLAGKVAQTNAVIAQTQATRQSMAARAQEMRMQQEQEARAQQQFQQQQEQHRILMPAIEAKARADIATAHASVRDSAYNDNLRTEFLQNQQSFIDEMNDALNPAQIEDGNGGYIDDNYSIMKGLAKVQARLAKYSTVHEAGGLMQQLTANYNGFKTLYGNQLDLQRVKATQDGMFNREVYKQDEQTARKREELQSKERIATSRNAALSAQQKQASAHNNYKAMMDKIHIQNAQLRAVAPTLTPEEYEKRASALNKQADEALSFLQSGGAPKFDQKFEGVEMVDPSGVRVRIVNGYPIPVEGEQETPDVQFPSSSNSVSEATEEAIE